MLNQEKAIGDFNGLTFVSDSNEVTKYSKQIERIIHLIKQNPKAVALVTDALKEGPIKVKINPPNSLEWPARWYGDSRTINLGISISKEKDMIFFLYCVLFELSNGANPFFRPGSKEAKMLSLTEHKDAESYARMAELAEHSTQVRVKDIYTHAQQNKIWPKAFFKYSKELTSSFPDTWKAVNKKGDKAFSHTDLYRQYYTNTTAQIKEMENRFAEIEKSNAQMQELQAKSQKDDLKKSADSDTQDSPSQSPKIKKK
jgi:hypothetical protein